jgi:DNA polymerase IV
MPLRRLFVDMNAYFASVEQNDRPELRGKPIGVVPVMARGSCCIAASYEAKRHGVRTGTPVWEARELCPTIRFILARHERYVEMHHKIVKAVAQCLPIDRVMSIDEMVCGLLGAERHPYTAERLAKQIKQEIRAACGEVITCSIGIAPNGLLAKLASDLKKPDGLTIIQTEELPTRLHGLKLTDFCGIGPRMEQRFRRYGIVSVQDLCSLSIDALSMIWGSRIHGERWYHMLRGDEVHEKPTQRRTVGHSHVLPPQLRSDDGAYGVLVKLIHKAGARLRDIRYSCGRVGLSVRYDDTTRFEIGRRVIRCEDTLSLLQVYRALWQERPRDRKPTQVAMVLSDLTPLRSTTPSLFDQDHDLTTISHAMDRINRQFGKNTIHFGTLCGSEDTAPTRIAFTVIPEFDPAST